LANLLSNRRLLQEKNSLALYGIRGVLLQLLVGLVLQESSDLPVVVRSIQYHDLIALVTIK
jgi:hypothetical protein